MNNTTRQFLPFSLLLLALLALGTLLVDNPARRTILAMVYEETVSPRDLLESYRSREFKLLLVPGHDNEFGGTAYLGIQEAEMNLLIARELEKLLAEDEHFKVETVRDLNSGEYTETFHNFFETEEERILAFREEKKSLFDHFLSLGKIEPVVIVHHNFARPEVRLRLYGINLWANENDIDLALHLHVNDVAGRKHSMPGDYTGFSVYVPERQYPNSRASKKLGEALAKKFKTELSASNLPEESGGVIEDQELAAVGSYATREGAAVLVEYGYIYEPKFWDPGQREATAKQMARLTYEGLVEYLDGK